jgi:hypothetical protein
LRNASDVSLLSNRHVGRKHRTKIVGVDIEDETIARRRSLSDCCSRHVIGTNEKGRRSFDRRPPSLAGFTPSFGAQAQSLG